MKRIEGLDGIRFVCAVFVLLGHFGLPLDPLFELMPHHTVVDLVQKSTAVWFNGPAAVIVFFVISGMCIHLPYTRGKEVSLLPYFSKRLIRIGVPALVAAGCWALIRGVPSSWNNTVFWSIFCEVTYYLLYPGLLLLRRALGWKPLILTSWLLALIIGLTNPERLRDVHNSYVAFGYWTWFIGLPCWMLGCALAETHDRFPSISRRRIWLARGFVLLVSIGLRIVKFHGEGVLSSNVITLNVFVFLVFLWVGLETAHAMEHGAWQRLEQAGLWSYSLYLMHSLAPNLLSFFGLPGDETPTRVAKLLLALALSYAFYLVVERPAHKWALAAGERMRCVSQQSPWLEALRIRSQ